MPFFLICLVTHAPCNLLHLVETVRMMVNMFDRDGNGTISFKEFIGLWNYIEKWKTCFQTYDLDGSGTIDGNELHKALRGFGYNLTEGMIALIMTKYDVRGQGNISFDNFVQSCVTVQTLTDAFRRIDVAGTGVVTMTYEQVRYKYAVIHVHPQSRTQETSAVGY